MCSLCDIENHPPEVQCPYCEKWVAGELSGVINCDQCGEDFMNPDVVSIEGGFKNPKPEAES